jgi:hypothetical protein
MSPGDTLLQVDAWDNIFSVIVIPILILLFC